MNIPLSYYVDWRGLENFRTYNFDAQGLPRVQYGDPVGLRYNVITIAQYGLYCFQLYDSTKNDLYRTRALVCAEWLVKNISVYRDELKAWVYDFDLDFYGLKAPWISAMAQGEGISLLLRAFSVDNNLIYLKTTQEAIKPFQRDTHQGGVVDFLNDGSLFFEEYPTQPASHVLNGFVFALLGVYDYARYYEEPWAHQLVEKGIKSLENNWRAWDTGYWTLYDLHPTHRLASHMYHTLHIRQMGVLADLFQNDNLRAIHLRWAKMKRNVYNQGRWLCGKCFEKIRLRRG